jgi:putative nucleotidyltransferase with HDIG domain
MAFNRATVEQDARAILYEWVTSDSLRKHCESVAASMRHFAQQRGEDTALWSAVGLLHDMDYEKHPNLELSDTGHPFVGVAWLREQGWPEEVTRAILSHADYSGVPRETPLEKTLYAVDELSGFVTAVALVRPTKSVHDVEVKSVKKKLKDKDFAAKVNRDDITRGAEELALPIDTLIGEVIVALRAAAPQLGLDGVAPTAS